MNDRKQTIKEFINIEKQFNLKKFQLESWKCNFSNLEEEIKGLISSFEKKFENLSTEHFNEDIKDKLENRREGIRLSVKSATRLLRKLNIEKELPQPNANFVTAVDILNNVKHYSRTEENSDENKLKEKQNDPESYRNTNNAIKPHSISELEIAMQSQCECEEITEVTPWVISKEHEEAEHITAKDKAEESYDNSVDEESLAHEELILGDLEKVKLPSTNKDKEIKPLAVNISDIQAALNSNKLVIDEFDECLASIENRFFSFIEKGIAPVLDGLYSGQNHAEEFIMELSRCVHDQVGDVKEWLKIYNQLMKEIEVLLEKFQVELYIPELGIPFDETKHEPIGVVEDKELNDEQLKEVVRYGIFYDEGNKEKSKFLIRPAQVIVIKNRN